jgi:hypothetical protein
MHAARTAESDELADDSAYVSILASANAFSDAL